MLAHHAGIIDLGTREITAIMDDASLPTVIGTLEALLHPAVTGALVAGLAVASVNGSSLLAVLDLGTASALAGVVVV